MNPYRFSLFTLFLAAILSQPTIHAAATSSATAVLKPRSIVNLVCCSSGTVSNLWTLDQTGVQDTPGKYVAFFTPGHPYVGYRSYFLPSSILSSVLGLQVKVNYKGPATPSQTWAWHAWNWSTSAWTPIGTNAAATAGSWTTLRFSISSPRAYIRSDTGEIRIRLSSSNASDDAKLDYEAVLLSYANTTYYIAPTGCSDQYTGKSLTQPWCTIEKAAKLVNPGDVVYMRAGVYKQYTNFSRSGTGAIPITFSGYQGEIAVWDGSNIPPYPPDPWAGKGAVMSIYADHLIFRNIDVLNSAVSGIDVTGSYNRFEHVSSHNNWASGLGGRGSYNTFYYCEFYDNKGSGAQAANVDGWAFSSGSHNIVRYSSAHGNSDDGFDAWRSKGNIFDHDIAFDNGWGLGGSVGDGNGFKLGGHDPAGNSDGGYNTVRFSVAYYNKFNGFDTNLGSHNRILNNTGYLNYRAGPGGNFRTFSYTNTFENNLSFDNHDDLRGPYISTHNSWDLGIANPQFAVVTPTSGLFLTLSAGSPAIDRGLNLGFSFRGLAPDLGAHEYVP